MARRLTLDQDNVGSSPTSPAMKTTLKNMFLCNEPLEWATRIKTGLYVMLLAGFGVAVELLVANLSLSNALWYRYLITIVVGQLASINIGLIGLSLVHWYRLSFEPEPEPEPEKKFHIRFNSLTVQPLTNEPLPVKLSETDEHGHTFTVKTEKPSTWELN